MSTYALNVTIESFPPDPYTGSVCCVINESGTVTPASESEAVTYCETLTVPAAGSVTIDLKTDDDVFGNPLQMIAAQVVDFKSVSANTTNVTVGAAASNGWANFVSAGGFILKPGTGLSARGLVSDPWLVEAANKAITITNASGSSVDVEVTVTGYN